MFKTFKLIILFSLIIAKISTAAQDEIDYDYKSYVEYIDDAEEEHDHVYTIYHIMHTWETLIPMDKCMVVLRHKHKEYCSGVILNERTILTARLCLRKRSEIRVYAGDTLDPKTIQKVAVRKMVQHPVADIALFFLDNKLKEDNKTVQIANLYLPPERRFGCKQAGLFQDWGRKRTWRVFLGKSSHANMFTATDQLCSTPTLFGSGIFCDCDVLVGISTKSERPYHWSEIVDIYVYRQWIDKIIIQQLSSSSKIRSSTIILHTILIIILFLY